MAINSISSIVNKLTGGDNGNPQHPFFYMDHRVGPSSGPSGSAGYITSFWNFNKSNGANGDISYSPRICDNTTIGAIPINNATGGRTLRLLGFESSLYSPGVIILYDRLADMGGLAANNTGINYFTLTPTRNVTGIGNEIWVEITTQIGTTTTSIVVTYENENGVTNTTPPTLIGGTGNREEGRVIRLPLAAGDKGVKKVIASQLNGSTGTAGGFTVLIANPITMSLNEQTGSASFRDFVTGTPVMPAIENNSCLTLAALCGSNNSLRGMFALHIIEG